MKDFNIENSDVSNRYEHSLKGFTAKLGKKQLSKIKNDGRVEFVEQNRIIILSPPMETNTAWWCYFFGTCGEDSGDPQVTPYGVDRVGGAAASNGTAWVIDTGGDLDHDDLNVDTQRSASFVSRVNSADDGNDHGTQVAGTIAALDNDIDVVGVAAGATVVSVRVFNSGGSGSTSQIVDGVDYVAGNASPVI